MSALEGPRRHFRLTDSTNERARDLALAGAPHGTVVTADEQSAGRGRHGRRWSAPPRAALLASAIIRPLGEEHRLLPLAVPLAVCEAAETLAPVQCRIKWPNDVWLEERKLGGVLIEARPPEWAVVGVGLNLSVSRDALPPDLRWPATSLGHGVAPEAALGALRETLGDWLAAPPEAVFRAFAERDALQGRMVSWEPATGEDPGGAGEPDERMVGRASGIDARGNLLVELPGGERVALGSGEVTLRL